MSNAEKFQVADTDFYTCTVPDKANDWQEVKSQTAVPGLQLPAFKLEDGCNAKLFKGQAGAEWNNISNTNSHTAATRAEVFFVLDGQVTMNQGDGLKVYREGDHVVIPAGQEFDESFPDGSGTLLSIYGPEGEDAFGELDKIAAVDKGQVSATILRETPTSTLTYLDSDSSGEQTINTTDCDHVLHMVQGLARVVIGGSAYRLGMNESIAIPKGSESSVSYHAEDGKNRAVLIGGPTATPE